MFCMFLLWLQVWSLLVNCVETIMFFVKIYDNYFVVKDISTMKVLLWGLAKHGLYKFWSKSTRIGSNSCHASLAKISLWHDFVTHIFYPAFDKFLSTNRIKVSQSINNVNTWKAYVLAKTHKFHFFSNHVNAFKPFDLM